MSRKMIIVILLFAGTITVTFAQEFHDPFRYTDQSSLTGGLGMTWIDGQPYTTFTIAPDIAIGNFGIGIYLQLLLDNNNDWKLRKVEYEDGPGILRAIRYIRYGQKYDPYYFRVGTLDRATMANGFLMWNYNNGSSYDKRKIGLIADMDFGQLGFESMWSSVGTSNLRGFTVYVRPLKFFEQTPPILDRLRFYTTYIRDSQVATGPALDSTGTLSAYSIGADFMWLDLPILKSTIYADYSKYVDYGGGKATGINVLFPEFIGILGVSARYEKRFLDDQFIPSLFGPLYELNRELGILQRLQNAPKTEGYFGELAGHILNRIRLIGNYQRLNGVSHSGVLHLEASAPDLVPKFELRGYYDKSGIETFEDARTLDSQSVLTGEVGYQLNRFLLLTMIYRWYWLEDPDNPGVFNPVERVEPRISFRYNF